VKLILLAALIATLSTSCGTFKKEEEVGPWADKRTRLQKLSTYEDERYDDWADKWMHRDAYKRKKARAGNKKNP